MLEAIFANVCYFCYGELSIIVRLLKEHDEVRLKWREQIERGWLQAQAGELVDGPKAMATIKDRLKSRTKKRA